MLQAFGTTLMSAFNQWANRPADERFKSLEELHAAVTHHRDASVEAPSVTLNSLRVVTQTVDGESAPALIGKDGREAAFTHHAFGQFARQLGAPASYLRSLPAELAAQNLNHGLAEYNEQGRGDLTPSNLLFTQNGELRLRALVSGKYRRIWNSDITARLIELAAWFPQWQPAPAAFDGSRGLYASDADMFAFMVNNDRRIFERGPAGGLSRGFYVQNSEVGDASFKITTFAYEYVCGNHRILGASNVQELTLRHVGQADERAFAELHGELTKYSDASAVEDELKVERAIKFTLGANKDAVLDRVFGLRVEGVTRQIAEQAYGVAVEREDRYGAPTSVWGFTGGLTEVARDLPIASDRVRLERAAGKIMQIAF